MRILQSKMDYQTTAGTRGTDCHVLHRIHHCAGDEFLPRIKQEELHVSKRARKTTFVRHRLEKTVARTRVHKKEHELVVQCQVGRQQRYPKLLYTLEGGEA